ncbi:MAG: hypothetical protein JWP97_3336, partial [Labilithrix sp.]|nr:hypothetical protein [Labilithrix sp.]
PDPRHPTLALLLGEGSALGLVHDRWRVVVGRGEPRIGEGIPDDPLAGALRTPARLGGGYVFWTASTLYRSATFDGALEPVVRLDDSITSVSFGPRSALVRTSNGERWALSLPRGERVALDPPGLADVEALDDGRALAIDDRGGALLSTDHGAHWSEVSSQLKAPPSRVAVVLGELWIHDDAGGGARLEPDGQLSIFDKQPVDKPLEIRAVDPRWRGHESPLRSVFEWGAGLDENVGLVLEHGDLVRVDLRSGELLAVLSGKLPPDARCSAVPTADDILFACTEAGSSGSAGGGASFVVSHALSGDAPVIEQSFNGTHFAFYASDDGGLAVPVPCDGPPVVGPSTAACVRQPGGTWQQVDLSALAGDAGAAKATIARWVPRADGRAVAILSAPTPGIFEPRSGAFVPFDVPLPSALLRGMREFDPGIYRSHKRVKRREAPLDGSWSFAPGSGVLRAWDGAGAILQIHEDGRVVRSPYAFPLAAAGPYALGQSSDGRYYQTLDHGASWVEVLGPPTAGVHEIGPCSTAGCEVGGFYRIGWAPRAPRPRAPVQPARSAADVRRTPSVELTCRSTGPAVVHVLPRTERSSDDLGLGMNRLPTAGDQGDVGYLRNPVPRAIVAPLHDTNPPEAEVAALRGLLTGYATTADTGTLEVNGPDRRASTLRRGLQIVPPFDPAAPVRKTALPMAQVLAAGRLAGMTNDEVLQDDMTEMGGLVALTSLEPSGPSDLLFNGVRGLLALVLPNERVRMAVRPPTDGESTIVSGVSLPADDVALLELESSGVEHVFRMNGAGGITDLFDVNARSGEPSFYPANPDALAIGPRRELGVVRIASGSDPPSAIDPALLLVPSQPPEVLAPWSTLRLADDPSCKEPGWRSTIQTIAPWVRVATPELRGAAGFMMARVKWSKDHVCLEALELGLGEVPVRPPPSSITMEGMKVGSWLVARGGVFSRVAIAEGVEWRQPLECRLAPR